MKSKKECHPIIINRVPSANIYMVKLIVKSDPIRLLIGRTKFRGGPNQFFLEGPLEPKKKYFERSYVKYIKSLKILQRIFKNFKRSYVKYILNNLKIIGVLKLMEGHSFRGNRSWPNDANPWAGLTLAKLANNKRCDFYHRIRLAFFELYINHPKQSHMGREGTVMAYGPHHTTLSYTYGSHCLKK